jgi:2-polyprenyl-3-methyl-5-hydroxy-6-metoxy-1,4-benzoquinol methylase
MFITPEELNKIALSQGLKNIDTKGISYNPLTKQAKLTKSTMANYISCFTTFE